MYFGSRVSSEKRTNPACDKSNLLWNVYCLLALGLTQEFETSKHSQLIGWFNRTYISTGIIDSKFGKFLTQAYNRRTKSDYDPYYAVDKTIVLEMFFEMKEFVTEIKRIIQTQD